jgi:oligogalacturonide lyase
MAKGDRYPNTIEKYRDPDTGREVWRLTSPQVLSTHPYFYFNCIAKDNSFAVFGSDLSGSRQFYRIDLKSGELTQLTDVPKAVVYQACLSLDDKTLIFATADTVQKLDMDTLECEVLYELGEAWWANKTFGVTPDCTHVVQVQLFREHYVSRAKAQSDLAAQWAKKPRCRLVIIDVASKTSKIVYDERLWVAHPQLRPVYKDKLMYCHEGPGYLIDSRIWLMDTDGSNILCPRPHGPNESFTHEFWFADGSALGYVAHIRDEAHHIRSTTLRKIDIDTMQETVIGPCTFYSHCVTNTPATLIVGDGRDPEKPYIFLTDLRTGKETPICRHDSKWGVYFDPGIGEYINQDAHPHPQFSQDSTKIIFNSDRDGKPCIFMTDISDLL